MRPLSQLFCVKEGQDRQDRKAVW